MHRTLARFIFVILISSVLSLPLLADSTKEATQRIKERLEQIDSLKASGDVGEDSGGYLVTRNPLGPRQASIVEAENADRKILYLEVAKRTGQTIEEVGAQRAIQIALRARKGVWLQKVDGEWYQKL